MPPGRDPKKQNNSKNWCEYCHVYVYNNNASRIKHENSPQHKAALQRFIQRVQKEKREEDALKREFATRTGVSLEFKKDSGTVSSSSSFYGHSANRKAQPVQMLGMKSVATTGPVMASIKKKPKILGEIPGMPQTAVFTGQRLPELGQQSPNNEDDGSDDAISDSPVDEPSSSEDYEANPDSEIAPAIMPPNASEQPVTSQVPSIVQKTPPLKIELRKFLKPANLRKL